LAPLGEGSVAIASSFVGASCVGAEAPPEVTGGDAREPNIGIPVLGGVALEVGRCVGREFCVSRGQRSAILANWRRERRSARTLSEVGMSAR
jgi:hypothetical protein